MCIQFGYNLEFESRVFFQQQQKKNKLENLLFHLHLSNVETENKVRKTYPKNVALVTNALIVCMCAVCSSHSRSIMHSLSWSLCYLLVNEWNLLFSLKRKHCICFEFRLIENSQIRTKTWYFIEISYNRMPTKTNEWHSIIIEFWFNLKLGWYLFWHEKKTASCDCCFSILLFHNNHLFDCEIRSVTQPEL